MAPGLRSAAAKARRRRCRGSAAAAILVLSSALSLAVASPDDAAMCLKHVHLPASIGETTEGSSQCPENSHFLKRVEEVEKTDDPERRRQGQQRPRTQPREGRPAPPDCRHELAMKLDFDSLFRRDLNGSTVVESARRKYNARLFRAAPDAITPTISYGLLSDVKFHVPGLHGFGKRHFDAEIHLIFQGEPNSWDAPDFTLVVPVETAWSWDRPTHPALDFLGRLPNFTDSSRCGWDKDGIAEWINHGFQCPPYELEVADLFQQSGRAMEYSSGHGCSYTFVLAESIIAAGPELALVRNKIENSLSEGDDGSVAAEPEVVVGLVLRADQTFTVFTEQEIRSRKKMFFLIMTGGVTVVVFIFLGVRRCSTAFEVEINEFVEDPYLQLNTKVDHWICFMASLVIPWVAYSNGSTNRSSGMPYEYVLVWFGFALLHMAHECILLIQVGGAVKRLSYFRVARLTVMSLMGLLNIELHIQFGIVAVMVGHTIIGWASILMFALCNAWNLVMVTHRCPPGLIFKLRSFEVVQAVYEERLKVDDVSMHVEAANFGKKLAGVKSSLLKRWTLRDDANENEDGGFAEFLFSCSNIIQCGLLIFFLGQCGSSPLIIVSLALTLFYVGIGSIHTLLPQPRLE